jgi:tetratricopeptide (TPR) repeat protein
MGPEHLFTAETIRALAELEDARGNHEEARGMYERALATRERVLGVLSFQTAEAYRHLIAILRAIGHYEEAARLQVALAKQEESVET